MREDETATGEGMPEAPETPAATRPQRSRRPAATTDQQTSTVTLWVAGPMWCTGTRLTLADGSTLLVTRKGAAVPADQAQALITTAAKHGVTLRSN